MTAAARNFAARTIRALPLAAGIVLLLAVEALLPLLGWLIPIEPILRGWLVAFAIFSCIPVGSLIWLLIHRLTGGEWGFVTAPVLRPAAAMVPLLILVFVPVPGGLRHIYPWAADPSAIAPDVARWYLNWPSFLARGAIALAGWSVFALVFVAGRGTRLLAGLGLAFFGFSISLVAVDWYLSLEPNYVATAFAAMIAIQELLAALAFAALIGPGAIDVKTTGDIGGLLIAALLGVVYLASMTFVIAWYGDLPDKAEWFLKRTEPGWIAILIGALTIGALLPFGMLMANSVRRNQRVLRIASALILFGTTLHFVWLLVPTFDDQAVVIAVAGLSGAALTLASLLIGPALSRLLEVRHAE